MTPCVSSPPIFSFYPISRPNWPDILAQFCNPTKTIAKCPFRPRNSDPRFCPKTLCTGFLRSLRIWAKPELLRENSKTPFLHKMAEHFCRKEAKMVSVLNQGFVLRPGKILPLSLIVFKSFQAYKKSTQTKYEANKYLFPSTFLWKNEDPLSLLWITKNHKQRFSPSKFALLMFNQGSHSLKGAHIYRGTSFDFRCTANFLTLFVPWTM